MASESICHDSNEAFIFFIIYRNNSKRFFTSFRNIPVRSKRMKEQQKTSAGRFVETKIQVCIPFLFPNQNEKILFQRIANA